MSQIGTQVVYTATPPTIFAPTDTSNAFMVGLADWGPTTTPITIASQAQVSGAVGPRSATNATSYDALDVYFREAAPQSVALFGRVAGPAASAASVTLTDASGSACLLAQAVYVGNYGNALSVAVVNAAGSYTLTITDSSGNVLAVSPTFATRGAAASWNNGFVTIVPYSNAATLPATATTTLSGGTDDRAHATLTHWTNALALFSSNLGPGQVLAPGQTNTNLNGIWTALGAHAVAKNRVAICDCDDGQTAGTIVADVGTQFNNTAAGPIGFWVGNLSCPGVVPNTTRSIPPSPVVAALCTQADAQGNPNLAAAGSNFQLQYVIGPATQVSGQGETYNSADRNTLNSAGVNVFANRFGTFENYGFVSSVLSATDPTYWQFNHFRLRMAIGSEGNAISETFVFSQLDAAGTDILNYVQQLTNMLSTFLAAGALFGTQPGTADAAFAVDAGPSVNTPQTMQAGNLTANLYVRMSPFAELVTIVVGTTPITQSVPVSATAQSTGLDSGLGT